MKGLIYYILKLILQEACSKISTRRSERILRGQERKKLLSYACITMMLVSVTLLCVQETAGIEINCIINTLQYFSSS